MTIHKRPVTIFGILWIAYNDELEQTDRCVLFMVGKEPLYLFIIIIIIKKP